MILINAARNAYRSKQTKRAVLIATIMCSIFAHAVHATPLNNVFDTQPIYNAFGLDKFYKRRSISEARLTIAPFYQQTSTARDNKSKKVPAGNRLGQWNMLGVFFGPEGAPTTLNFADPVNANETYKILRAAQRSVQAITEQERTGSTVGDNRYRVGPEDLLPATPDTSVVYAGGFTNEKNFNPSDDTFVYADVYANYEKIGLRSQFNFDFCFGFGVAVKWGVVDVKQYPKNFVLEQQFLIDAGQSTPETPPKNGDPAPADALALFNTFMDPLMRNRVAKDLGLDLTSYHKTDAEDIHVQAYWHFPVDFKDSAGDVGVTMVPYIAVGGWFPVSEKVSQDKPFAVPTGNDGRTGLTVDVSLAFDFPILPRCDQTLQLAFGGGILMFDEKDRKDQRFPSSEFQNGLIPWKIALLNNHPGLTWYFNISGKSEEFIEGLSVYFDFIYTQHLRDRIILKDPNPTRNAAFQNGYENYILKTSWKNQQINIGSNYRLANWISLGGAVQAHISGVRVYRSVTLLGNVVISF